MILTMVMMIMQCSFKYYFYFRVCVTFYHQCFDVVDWATGRTSLFVSWRSVAGIS